MVKRNQSTGYEPTFKRTSIGRGKVKTSSMNKHK